MKHIFTAAVIVLLVTSLSNSAFAHSHLGESNPADGDVITESLNEIVLNFEGKIEQGSFIDVTASSGQAIELQEIIIGDGTLTGIVAEPFPNDKYQVNWSIISTDGHPLEGEFSFTVNMPVAETDEQAIEEASEKTSIVEETTTAPLADEVEKESSSTTVILVVLLVILVAGGIFSLTRRKK